MNQEDAACVRALVEMNKQAQFDIGVLVSVIAMQALAPCRTRRGLANLIDRAGGDSDLYKTSTIRKMAATIRGGTFRPDLTVIEGGKAGD